MEASMLLAGNCTALMFEKLTCSATALLAFVLPGRLRLCYCIETVLDLSPAAIVYASVTDLSSRRLRSFEAQPSHVAVYIHYRPRANVPMQCCLPHTSHGLIQTGRAD